MLPGVKPDPIPQGCARSWSGVMEVREVMPCFYRAAGGHLGHFGRPNAWHNEAVQRHDGHRALFPNRASGVVAQRAIAAMVGCAALQLDLSVLIVDGRRGMAAGKRLERGARQ